MNDHQAPQNMQEIEQRSAAAAKKKRTVKVILIVFAVIAVVSVLGAMLDPDRLTDRWFGEEEQPKEIYFYPEDDEKNSLQNAEYLGLDHRVFYSDPTTGATYSLEEADLPTAEPFARFFYYYFETVMQGDATGYAVHFSDAYLTENELPGDFTVQMIYDIHVRPYLVDGTDERSAYLVDYKIYRNNGTFRDDMGSNASRTLLFYLVEENGELCIDGIVPYTEY